MRNDITVYTFAVRDVNSPWLSKNRPNDLTGYVLQPISLEEAERVHYENPNKHTTLFDLRANSIAIGGCACWSDLVGLINEFNQDGN
jgi:hypothetical protein